MSISCAVCWSVDYRSLQIALSSPVSVPFHRSYPERVTRDALHLLREGPDLIRSERSWSDSGQLEGRRELGIERGRRFFQFYFLYLFIWVFGGCSGRVQWRSARGLVRMISLPTHSRPSWFNVGRDYFSHDGTTHLSKNIAMIKRCQYQAIRHSFLNSSDIFRNDFDSFWQKSAH